MIIISLWIDSKPAVYLLTACLSIPDICQLTKWFYFAMYLFSTSVSLMVWCSSNTTGKSLALLSTIQFVTTLQVCVKWLHWWDSIGIMFTAGTLDWYNSQYIGQESVDTWPIYWSTVSRHSVDSQSTVGQQSVDSWSTNCFF